MSKPTRLQRNKGQFVKGHTKVGGRVKGVKNKATEAKEAVKNKGLLMMARKAPHIIQKALEMAEGGDKDMIKFVLEKFMAKESGESKAPVQAVQVVLQNLTAPPVQNPGPTPTVVIEQLEDQDT